MNRWTRWIVSQKTHTSITSAIVEAIHATAADASNRGHAHRWRIAVLVDPWHAHRRGTYEPDLLRRAVGPTFQWITATGWPHDDATWRDTLTMMRDFARRASAHAA